jgi:hypothetical protein
MMRLSKSEWKERGFVPKNGEQPRAYKNRGYGCMHLFDEDQVRPLKKAGVPKPAYTWEEYTAVDVARAAFAVNRSAKRHRDAAQSTYRSQLHGFAGQHRARKETAYQLKDRAIAWLAVSGYLSPVALHGGLVLYRGQGFCFHSTLKLREWTPETEDTVPFLKEACPRESGEMRIRDAVALLEKIPDLTSLFTRLAAPRMQAERYNDTEYTWDDDGEIF